jgi:ABC-type branched-subunit amino acid transport system permease subunit
VIHEKVGKDEWVATYQQRLASRTGLLGAAYRLGESLPAWAWLALLIVTGLLVPAFTDNAYVIRVVGTIALMATLAIGLNVVVGYAGLLDLGFVAFYGIGGYAYAYLSGEFTGLHWPTWASLLAITLLTALFGLLLGSPSLRLVGDYLAIVTLGFGQIFVQLTTSMTRVNLPGRADPVNLTGGPNGIVNLDPFRLLGFTARSVVDYYYVLLAVLIVVLVVVYRLNRSRIGRAWRALREDELAAEMMGMPTRRLKLEAFAIGAAIAGLSGALFAAWQGSVFPGNFDITLLITLYAIVVLGGMGSLPGVLLGAAIMIAVPEILRDPAQAGLMFYVGVIVVLIVFLRRQMLLLIAGISIFASVVKLLLSPAVAGAGMPPSGSLIVDSIRNWLVIPANFTLAGNLAFGALLLMIWLVTRIKQRTWRLVALIPTLYVLVFVWETRLSQEPSITRLLFVGVLLVLLMIYRPNGLLGQKRVEIA